MNRLAGDREKRLFPIGLSLLLLVGLVFAFAQMLHHDFVLLDDVLYITDNPKIGAGLTLDNIYWALTTFYADFWHPLTWLSYFVDVEIFGTGPIGFHITNLVLHTLNTFLLFFSLWQMTDRLGLSWIVAALFTVHPLHVESVAWAAERKDLLSTFFWIVSMWLYAGYARNESRSMYLASLLAFMLGLMAKPMLVTLPCVFLLLDLWPLGRIAISTKEKMATGSAPAARQKRKAAIGLVTEKLPFFLLSLLTGIVAYLAQNAMNSLVPFADNPLGVRIANAVVAYGIYLKKMVWPMDLAVFYPYDGMPPAWQVVGVACFLVLISGFVLKNIGRYPWLFVGWLWYLGTLVPVIGLIQVGDFAFADRYTYIPMIGIFIGIAWGAGEIGSKNRTVATAIAVAGVAAMILLTVRASEQVRCWKDSVSLFRQALSVTRENEKMLKCLGLAYEYENRPDLALIQYEKALLISPDAADVYNRMGIVWGRRGEHEKAVAHFQKALTIAPKNTDANYNLGLSLNFLGRQEEAVAWFQKALAMDPANVDILNNLAVALIRLGKVDAAKGYLEEAIKNHPGHSAARKNLEKLMTKQDP